MDIHQLEMERRVTQEITHAKNTRERLLRELDNLEAALQRARNEAESLPKEGTSPPAIPQMKAGWRFPWKH